MERTSNCLAKLDRMNKALRHEEPDRMTISDFFWGSFVKRWRKDLNLPDCAEPYSYYDLDWIVTTPNMDSWIRSFETIREDDIEVVVKTGFGATMRKRFDFQMPEFMSFDIDTIEKLQAVEFDDPYDRRRYYEAGDNQIAGVGDGFERNTPAWVETVKSLHPNFPVYGSIIECSECLSIQLQFLQNMEKCWFRFPKNTIRWFTMCQMLCLPHSRVKIMVYIPILKP
jgi:hypothetical protein